MNTNQTPEKSKTSHVPFLEIPLHLIYPSPENDTLYKPIDGDDPTFQELVASVREHGIREPLVLTSDHHIISGHRRYEAARWAHLPTAPCRFESITRDDPDFVNVLRDFNRQRIKSVSEQLRESVLDSNPDEAYRAMLQHRDERARLDIQSLAIEGEKRRSAISSAREPMLAAIDKVLSERRRFWPLSDRSIHYALLNEPPLIHAKKPESTYRNDASSYKALTDLVTRARLVRRIPMEAIADPTRPVSIWDVHDAPKPFFARELDGFLKGYRRNLQQSQPNHIEIMGEKNTVESTLRPVAFRYNISMTIGRGFSSLEPRYKMARRFEQSGKQNLVLLVLSDFDPSGEEICQSFARSLRDDFGIWDIHLFKVGLTGEQIARYQLPPMMQAKQSDSRTRKFEAKHGSDVYELEALPPETLQSELTAAIDSVLDVAAFNQELDAEKKDAAYLDTIRRRAHAALHEMA